MDQLAFAVLLPALWNTYGPDLDNYARGRSGDDNLVAHALLGEPPIAQDYQAAGTGATGQNGETLRADDPNDPLNPETRTYFTSNPLEREDNIRMSGRRGADEFLVRSYISGKPSIVAQHADGGVIDWNNVAGENDNAHDHWVDFFGKVIILDYRPEEGDTIRVQGHTVALHSIVHRRGRSYIKIQSQQGNGGGAHDEDILGEIVVYNATLNEDDIEFTQTNDGIVPTFPQFVGLVTYYSFVEFYNSLPSGL